MILNKIIPTVSWSFQNKDMSSFRYGHRGSIELRYKSQIRALEKLVKRLKGRYLGAFSAMTCIKSQSCLRAFG